MSYLVLDKFRSAFEGHPYLHRNSTIGDSIAVYLFEDLYKLDRSTHFVPRINAGECVVNTANKRQGIKARRGDGTFGELIPHEPTIIESGFMVPRGKVATVEIGVEVKILAKAMIKQIDRVTSDLQKQVTHFKKGSGSQPLCVALIGINCAPYSVGYEGDREFKTDGKSNRHPIQEAAEAERRLVADAKTHFDEFIFLRYRATNEPPFYFEWVDQHSTEQDYGSALVRLSREYDRRF